MTTPATTSDYMLLFRGNDWDTKLSPEELQQVMSKWTAWYDQLIDQGKIKSAHPLIPEGRVVSQKKGQAVADGPFAESKEAIGGYFLIQMTNLDEALQIAKRCPALPHGMVIEVRPIADVCPKFQRISRELAHSAY
ncbi:MAG TPA: YciI family protein [Chthoniobacterales bacterium]